MRTSEKLYTMLYTSKKQKHSYYLFLALMYYFLLRDLAEQRIMIIRYTDELIAVLALPIAFLKIVSVKGIILSKKDNYWPGIFVMIFSGLLGNIMYHYQPFVGAALPDLLLCVKFWLWIEVGRCLYKRFDVVRYAKKVFKHVRIIIWFYLGMTLMDNILHIFPADMRNGFRSTTLFYFHPTSFASCMVFLMAILIMIRTGIEKKQFYFYELILSLLACTSWRSKIIGSVLLFWLIVFVVQIKKKKVTLRTMVMFVPPVLLIGWNQIHFYFMSDMIQGSARYQLLTKSFLITRDHLPIGAGFSTFASYYSGVYYSPLYSMYGISNVFGITETNTSYISDSFWPMIFGQVGLIGTAGFTYALYKLYRNIQKTRTNNRIIYTAGLFVLAYLLVESTASAAFTHPIYMPIAFVVAYLLNCAYIHKNNTGAVRNNNDVSTYKTLISSDRRA